MQMRRISHSLQGSIQNQFAVGPGQKLKRKKDNRRATTDDQKNAMMSKLKLGMAD